MHNGSELKGQIETFGRRRTSSRASPVKPRTLGIPKGHSQFRQDCAPGRASSSPVRFIVGSGTVEIQLEWVFRLLYLGAITYKATSH